VLIDRDLHGWYEQCLQCGYQRDLPKMDKARQQVPEEAKKKE
jgi:hypothetical protein